MSNQNAHNIVSPFPELVGTPDWTVVPASPGLPNESVSRTTSPASPEMKMSKTLSAPALMSIVQDPLEELLNEIRDLKVSHQYQIEQLKLVIEAQSKMIKDIRILRFDQEAMIQSMVTEGKKISPYVEPDKRDLTSLMFPSNSFSFQRNLNWGIRSGKPTPFIAEHTCQKVPGVIQPIQIANKKEPCMVTK
jgi:hypothetical protein